MNRSTLGVRYSRGMVRLTWSKYVRLIAVVSSLALCACAVRMPITEYSDAPVPLGDISLAFVTSRNVETGTGGRAYYGEKRGPVSAGYCFVDVTRQTVKLDRIVRAAPQDVIASLGNAGSQPDDALFVYVHGYAESFGKSCRRAALMTDQLKLNGRLLLFTWPANSSFLTYAPDVADLEWSLGHIKQLLIDLASTYGARRINVIAHSLGTRGVVDALASLDREAIGAKRFGELILIAPDVDRDRFAQQIPALGTVVTSITVFVSDADRPLGISRTVNDSPRLGRADDVSMGLDGVDIVDVSTTGRGTFSGHLYHLYNSAVAEELRRLVGTAADDEPAGFRREATNAAGYWRLVPAGGPTD